jgi:hypothetical protein
MYIEHWSQLLALHVRTTDKVTSLIAGFIALRDHISTVQASVGGIIEDIGQSRGTN